MKLTARIAVATTLFAGLCLAEAPATAPATASAGAKTTTGSGLTIIRTSPGESVAEVGDTVYVLYTGKLENGTQFDSTADRNNTPYACTLGKGAVIKGWEEGLLGVKVGEKRTLIVPPQLAYGPQQKGEKIPPNSTLVFDLEIVGLRKAAK